METTMISCEDCGKLTPHESAGFNSQETDADGRVYQCMKCAICGISTKVYFKRETNEFRENFDAPSYVEADPESDSDA